MSKKKKKEKRLFLSLSLTFLKNGEVVGTELAREWLAEVDTTSPGPAVGWGPEQQLLTELFPHSGTQGGTGQGGSRCSQGHGW